MNILLSVTGVGAVLGSSAQTTSSDTETPKTHLLYELGLKKINLSPSLREKGYEFETNWGYYLRSVADRDNAIIGSVTEFESSLILAESLTKLYQTKYPVLHKILGPILDGQQPAPADLQQAKESTAAILSTEDDELPNFTLQLLNSMKPSKITALNKFRSHQISEVETTLKDLGSNPNKQEQVQSLLHEYHISRTPHFDVSQGDLVKLIEPLMTDKNCELPVVQLTETIAERFDPWIQVDNEILQKSKTTTMTEADREAVEAMNSVISYVCEGHPEQLPTLDNLKPVNDPGLSALLEKLKKLLLNPSTAPTEKFRAELAIWRKHESLDRLKIVNKLQIAFNLNKQVKSILAGNHKKVATDAGLEAFAREVEQIEAPNTNETAETDSKTDRGKETKFGTGAIAASVVGVVAVLGGAGYFLYLKMKPT